jgi:tetratricopeptide (TPR) repeat protein
MLAVSLLALLPAFHAVPQRSDGADADRTVARGRVAFDAGRFDEASRALEAALEAKPDDARGWALLARARCAWAEERAAKGDGELAAAQETIAKAEEAARKAVELEPASAESWAALGHVLAREGQVDEAIATLYQAEKLAPPTAALLIDLADALLAARQAAFENQDAAGASTRLAEAQGALERASRLFDAQVDVLRRQADVHGLKGEPELALADFRRAVQLRPNDPSLLEEHLKLVARTERIDEAIDFYTGLIDTPALSRWYRSRAKEMRANQELQRSHDYAAAASDYQAAEQDFRASGRLDPALQPAIDAYLPSLRTFRGHALTLAERFPEAEAALLSAIDLDPKHEGALAKLHDLQDAMWKKFGGDSMPKEKWEEMRSFASKLATVEPGNAANWNNQAFFAREAGKYEESYLAYRRALQLDPTNARYLNDTALILLYHLDRDLDRAQRWLEQAIELGAAGRDDDERATGKRKEDESALIDAYGNLINLFQGTSRKEQAIARLREFAARFPTRSEVDYWKEKLLPDEWKAEQEQKKADAEAKKAAEEAKKKAAEDAKKAAEEGGVDAGDEGSGADGA